MKKRILTWLLAMLTVCSILPAAAWANVETKGPCGAQGDNVGWAWSSANDGTLTIGGEGAMADFDSANPIKAAPWSQLEYTTVNFAGNITHIGSFSFPKSKVGRFLAVGHTVRLPSTVTSIGQGAFYGCVYMQDVILPAGLTVLESAVFKGCNDLRYITLPVGVKRIERETFMGCSSMTNIVIQAADLSYIGTDAFLGCSSLTDVYFRGSKAQWGKILAGAGNSVLTTVNVHYNYTGSVAPTLGTPDLTLTRDVQTDKPCLNWTAVEGASQYEVYRSATGAADSFKLIHSTTSTAYVDTSAVGGTTYYYTVRAINGLKFGLDSDPQSMTCPAAPARPSLTLTTDRSGKPVLKWTSVKDATAYEVFRSATGAAGSFSIVRRTSYLTWTDANTEMGKMYYYVVRAKNGSLCGKFSPAQSVKCPIVLSVPSMTLDLNKSTGKPVISWTSVPFATQYEIYRSATGADKSYRIIRRTALLNYTDTTAASGTTYYYVVRAMRGTGSSAIYSRFCKAQSTTSAVPPSTPTVTLRIDDTTGKPVISWSKTANAAQYEIYRSTTGADKSYRIIRRTALLNYTDTTAVAGTTYYYVVRAIQGTSPNIFRGRFCPAQSIRCAAVPGVPDMALTTDIDTGHIVISWSAATDAAQYEVFRSTDGSSFSSVCRTAALTWTDPNTESGVTYYYKVRGITDSVKGAFCKAQSIAVPGVPSMTLSNDSDTGRNVVSWSSVACATEYEVYRSANGGDYQSVRRTSALTYTDLDTDYGVTYSYKVRAIYSAAPAAVCGAFCTPDNIRCAALSPVSGLTMSYDDETHANTANWESVCGAESYEVYRSTDGETYQRAGSTRELTYIDNDASEYGVTYYYKVRARNSNTVGDFSQPQSIQCVFKIIASGTWQTDYPIAWAGNTGRWTLYGNGTLVISGNRVTMPWFKEDTVPWDAYRDKIWSVVIRSGVANIGGYSFYNCSNLTRITIPDSVTSIGDYAFCSCTSLRNISLPDSITAIGDSAFYNGRFTSINIPAGVTSISDRTFYSCDFLTSVAIPEGVTSIGEAAFSECINLHTITIPNSVTTIGEYAFFDCVLAKVTIPNSVTTIGKCAFSSNSALTTVTIPGSVTAMKLAFRGCSRLTSVTILEGVTEISAGAFSYCSNLTSVTIPDSVTSIKSEAFYKCINLASVIIPDRVTEIGGGAFGHCSKLTSIAIPSSITEIGYFAFEGCDNLKEVYYGGSEEDWSAVSIGRDNDPLKSATILYNQTEPWR